MYVIRHSNSNNRFLSKPRDLWSKCSLIDYLCRVHLSTSQICGKTLWNLRNEILQIQKQDVPYKMDAAVQQWKPEPLADIACFVCFFKYIKIEPPASAASIPEEVRPCVRNTFTYRSVWSERTRSPLSFYLMMIITSEDMSYCFTMQSCFLMAIPRQTSEMAHSGGWLGLPPRKKITSFAVALREKTGTQGPFFFIAVDLFWQQQRSIGFPQFFFCNDCTELWWTWNLSFVKVWEFY